MINFSQERKNVTLDRPIDSEFVSILTDEALGFVAFLHQKFNARRLDLLKMRAERQHIINQGVMPCFMPENDYIKTSDWQVGSIPQDLQNRKVEITGPTSRKMVINALNSGANTFMADFEDSNCPSWNNMIEGQINVRDAVLKNISYSDPVTGKYYELAKETATLIIRPRGWHLDEAHVKVNGEVVSGAIFDFAMYFFHNYKALHGQNSGTYFYLPKLENHLEARLWNDIFTAAQSAVCLPQGFIKATVLIETILAAFEMEEIIYELREHCVGLNCGRWDYIFSMIKFFHNHEAFILPDRAQITMTTPNMRAYCLQLVKTCHKRGAFAIGGMAAQIPIKNDPQANEAALACVRSDKEREVKDGFDGTWVAHPGIVQLAKEIFEAHIANDNQLDCKREDVVIHEANLLEVPKGTITDQGVMQNIRVGLRYISTWLSGNGCVPIFHLMEDAATAEICRAQLWQWANFNICTTTGTVINHQMLKEKIIQESSALKEESNSIYSDNVDEAASILIDVIVGNIFINFLTLPTYDAVLKKGF